MRYVLKLAAALVLIAALGWYRGVGPAGTFAWDQKASIVDDGCNAEDAQPAAKTRENDQVTIARLELGLAEKQREIDDLRLDLKRAEDHAARYRSGLERAVSELNEMSSQRAAERIRESTTARRSRSRGSRSARGSDSERRGIAERILVRSTPNLRVLGDQIFATGEIVNKERVDLAGWLTVELRRNGRRVDVQRRLIELPAGARLPYSERFLITGFATGEFSARAWLDA